LIIVSLLAEASGWLIVALMAITVTLPYLLRGRILAVEGWSGVPYLHRLRPHFWIGYAIAGLGLLHAVFAMSSRVAWSGPFAIGIWIAAIAMALAFVQAMLGGEIRLLRAGQRVRQRRAHLRIALILAALGAAHLLLNGALTRSIFGVIG
jgi:hypothetical protein